MEKPNGRQEVSRGLQRAKNVKWCEPFDDKNLSYPFFSDKDDDVTYTANAMYKRFSYITRHGQTVMFMGDQPTWYEWIGQIVGPHDNEKRRKALKDCIIDRPVSENGYLWSWAYAPHWPTATMNDLTGREEHYHYDHLFRFINGVYEVIVWDGNTDILSKKGRKKVTYKRGRYGKKWRYHDIECNHEGEDVSKGKTVREKLDMAVNYILEDMHGKDGLIILDENLNNGKNLGRIGDASSNYWDNFLFGYKDAYENMLFYGALLRLSAIERAAGNPEKADYYVSLSEKVKDNFNKIFWDDEKGRYIACEDVDGERWDYGLTYLNLEAIYFGLCDKERTDKIFSWLNGDRIIEGDRSVGKDIYHFKFAPRANTFAMEDGKTEFLEDRTQYWYFDWYGVAKIENEWAYGQHFQNGGAIFYYEFYDIMDRIKYISPEDALNRWKVLSDEYRKDALVRRTVSKDGNGDMEGIIREFAESGLIPLTWLYGFMGITAKEDGIYVEPHLPEEYKYMGMDGFTYADSRFKVTVFADGKVTFEALKKAKKLPLNFIGERYKNAEAVLSFNGKEIARKTLKDNGGKYTFSADKIKKGCVVTVSPFTK